MKKKKNNEEIVRSQCKEAIDSSASACSECGNTAVEQESTPRKKKNVSDFFGALFSAFFCMPLTASVLLFMFMLFIHALNENIIFPSVGAITGEWLAEFSESRYFLALGVVLILIPLSVIILINTHRARRVFFAGGCSVIASAALSIVAAIFRSQMLKMLSAEWQDTLINTTAIFKDFCIIYAMILIVIGATCLSIYACITAIKGGKHEKNI